MNDDERSNEFRACCLRTPFPHPPSLPHFTRIISIIETELASMSPERRNQTCCPATRQASQRDIKRKKKKRKSRLGQLSSNLSLTQNRQSLADQSVSKPFSLSLLSPASAFKSGLLSPSLAFHSLAGR